MPRADSALSHARPAVALATAERAALCRRLGVLLLWLVLGASLGGTSSLRAKASASEPASVAVTARVSVDPKTHLPDRIAGQVVIRGWKPEHGACLYLPYNDPDYGENRGAQRRVETVTGLPNRSVFEKGETTLTAKAPLALDEQAPYPFVAKLKDFDGGEITLDFASVVPRLPGTTPNEWFYDGFFPQITSGCRAAELDARHHRNALPAQLSLTVHYPFDWQLLGPAVRPEANPATMHALAHTLAFGLGQGFERTSYLAQGVPIHVSYRTSTFRDLLETVDQALAASSQILGPYPFAALAVVESGELQRHGLPGLIALNQPQQSLFGHVQRDWMNWQHWAVAMMLTRQWYGAAIDVAASDDLWLLEGIGEFATQEILRRLPSRYNLFNATRSGFRLISFDYLQLSEISAATLLRFAPFARLTDETLHTALVHERQPALLYAKQAAAMRQLKSFAGEKAFFGFLRSFTRSHAGQTISPRDFALYLDRLPSPFSPRMRQELTRFLGQWWTQEGFPDFALLDAKYHAIGDGRWLAQVTAEQRGSIDFPPEVGVEDESGRISYARAVRPAKPAESEGRDETAEASWQADIITPYEPVKSIVDPRHDAFDADRFNNATGLPSVQFLPGSAKTLKDDGYTVVWLPYAFRRPAEPFSLGVQGALFRYVSGSLFVRAETAPATRQGAVEARQRFEFHRQAIQGDLSLSQTYEGDRQGEAALVRSPLFALGPHLSASVKARHKVRVGRAKTGHESFVAGLGVKPETLGTTCSYKASFEIERAPRQLAPGFSYERKIAVASGSCRLTARSDLSLRLFRGDVSSEGEAPEAAFFKPTELREARLRLDLRGLARVRKLAAANADLFLPLYLPLPKDSLVLTRQLRLRLFHDFGRAFDLAENYRSFGFGIMFPLGGDLSGAGSFALTRLSVIAIVSSTAGERRSQRPGIVVDLSGEL